MDLKVTQNKRGIDKRLNDLLSRSKSVSTFLNRVIFPRYQQAQLERWKTEGASENTPWPPLSPKYAERKRRKFAAYPGAGKAMMIATGKLVNAATGRGPGLQKLITDKQMTVTIREGIVPYAKYAASKRPIMKFAKETISEWKVLVWRYMISGEMK